MNYPLFQPCKVTTTDINLKLLKNLGISFKMKICELWMMNNQNSTITISYDQHNLFLHIPHLHVLCIKNQVINACQSSTTVSVFCLEYNLNTSYLTLLALTIMVQFLPSSWTTYCNWAEVTTLGLGLTALQNIDNMTFASLGLLLLQAPLLCNI